MRILFVVQRYGAEVNGGAEQHCRWLAEAMNDLGHEVHVATTKARDYATWADHYPEQQTDLNGVVVHRFPVDVQRDTQAFNEFSRRIDFTGYTHPLEDELEWLRLQGPISQGLDQWIDAHGESFDVAVVFTYLYRSAHYAVHRLAGRVPLAMHATAHDEPPFHLRSIQALLRQVDLFLCSTPEESDLIGDTVGQTSLRRVVGVGVPARAPVDVAKELASLGLNPSEPYALILGRVDGSKGVVQAIDALRKTGSRGKREPTLVVAGQNVAGLQSEEDVRLLDYVNDDQVTALLQGCSMLIQPSPWESFSLVLCEAWLAGKPVVVNSASDVMAAHVLRSQGGLTFQSAVELRSAVDRLMVTQQLRERLGTAGQRYVEAQFKPQSVSRRIEGILLKLASSSRPPA